MLRPPAMRFFVRAIISVREGKSEPTKRKRPGRNRGATFYTANPTSPVTALSRPKSVPPAESVSCPWPSEAGRPTSCPNVLPHRLALIKEVAFLFPLRQFLHSSFSLRNALLPHQRRRPADAGRHSIIVWRTQDAILEPFRDFVAALPQNLFDSLESC